MARMRFGVWQGSDSGGKGVTAPGLVRVTRGVGAGRGVCTNEKRKEEDQGKEKDREL